MFSLPIQKDISHYIDSKKQMGLFYYSTTKVIPDPGYLGELDLLMVLFYHRLNCAFYPKLGLGHSLTSVESQ